MLVWTEKKGQWEKLIYFLKNYEKYEYNHFNLQLYLSIHIESSRTTIEYTKYFYNFIHCVSEAIMNIKVTQCCLTNSMISQQPVQIKARSNKRCHPKHLDLE